MIKRNIFSSCSHLDVNPFWKRLRGVLTKGLCELSLVNTAPFICPAVFLIN